VGAARLGGLTLVVLLRYLRGALAG
jgi:hypothetical protein